MPKVINRIQIARAVTRKAFNEALERAALSHVEVAKQLAPVDTGRLRDGIRMSRENGLQVVSEAPYSAYVEFGTVNSDAQPFFVPAFESAMRQLREEIADITSRRLRAA